jgi:predicted RNA-binding protein YlqC (UPF0109 family)
MSADIDQQFVEYVVKALVGNPDAVSVNRTVDERGVLLELTVDPDDLGRVIGKRGATAQSLRTLLRALGTKNDARYNLKIVDNGEPRPAAQASDDIASTSDDTASTSDDSGSRDEDTASASDTADSASEPENATEESVSEASGDEERDDVVSKTRKELAELDDLDV